jgi:hypothetical protein
MYKFEKIVEAQNVWVPSSCIGESGEDDGTPKEVVVPAQKSNGDRSGYNHGELVHHDDDARSPAEAEASKLIHDSSSKEPTQKNDHPIDEENRSIENKVKLGGMDSEIGVQAKHVDGISESDTVAKSDTFETKHKNSAGTAEHVVTEVKSECEGLDVTIESTNQDADDKECMDRMKDTSSYHSDTSKVVRSSFAEVDGGSYTDAGKVSFPGRCPIGGCWKGYFENVSVSVLVCITLVSRLHLCASTVVLPLKCITDCI